MCGGAWTGWMSRSRRSHRSRARKIATQYSSAMELLPGLYESLVTDELAARVAALSDDLVEQRSLAPGEAADRIALYLSREITRALADVADDDRVAVSLQIAQRLFDELAGLTQVDAASRVTDTGWVLRSVLSRRPDGSPAPIAAPLTPLLDTTLLTNARAEPTLWSQLNSEIESAQRIDVVMAFIRRSGIRPLVDALRRHCETGRPLRVLTTTYTASTEMAALDELQELGADIRVSYDLTSTRLHAKSWLFHRAGEYSTAYVGSSNLTHSAQVTGLEWNVRVSAARNELVVQQVAAVFNTYWNSGDFLTYDPTIFEQQLRQTGRSTSGPTVILSPIELQPRPFQQRLLELLQVSREAGHHRNLLVAATGTGKTVMAALDYAALRKALPRARLLFVAHREEILDQSMATFRYALRDASFGEKWVGGHRPKRFDHVFASIQSFAAPASYLLTTSTSSSSMSSTTQPRRPIGRYSIDSNHVSSSA